MQKLPVDISTFSELRTLNYLYVDKTEYVYHMITGGRRYFLSRPRRFGKSLLVSTLKEVLIGNKQLFNDLWIASSDYDWHEYGVIDLDFSRLKSTSLELFKQSLVEELYLIAQRCHLTVDKDVKEPDFLLKNMIHALFEKYGKVAILIDEYDSQILKTLKNKPLAVEIRDEIQQFFTTIKSLDQYVQFVFITGVSSFAKAGLFSGINNLQIITLRDKYAAICGCTDAEIDHYFKEHITVWSQKIGISYDNLREQIRSWYNGYSFGYNVVKVYNPFSVLNAFHVQEFENFWFQSGTPTFLVEVLKKEYTRFDPERLIISKDMLGMFDVEAVPAISLMFQTGYLTIIDYDSESGLYTLNYPNDEVKKSFQKYLLEVLTNIEPSLAQNLSAQFFTALNQHKVQTSIDVLKQFFAHIPYQLHMKEERYYHSVLAAICTGAGIKSLAEVSTADGRIDLVMEFKQFIYVVEIKSNDTAEKALTQIEEREYYQRFLSCGKQVILLGVAFKKEPNNFDIEYIEKQL